MSTLEKPAVNPLRLSLVLALLTAFGPFANDMYLSGFSDIAEAYQTNAGHVQLGLSLYFAGSAVGQLIYGPLIDRLGRKGPLIVGVFVFSLASFALAHAPGIDSFIALRFMQALGGCAGMIVSRAIIADLFAEREAARVLSLMMMVQGMAPVIAPILGGYLIAWAGWRSVFLFLTGFGVVCAIAAALGVKETLAREKRSPISIRSVFVTFLFLLRERRFMALVLTGSFSSAGIFAFISGSPFIYMEIFGVGKMTYGWLFGLNAVGMIMGSFTNRMLLKRFMPWQVARVSVVVYVLMAISLVVLTSLHSLPVLVMALLFCLPSGLLIGANTVAMAMTSFAGNRGAASSMIGVVQFTCAALSSAFVGLMHNGTAYPMVGTILVLACLSCLVFLVGVRRV